MSQYKEYKAKINTPACPFMISETPARTVCEAGIVEIRVSTLKQYQTKYCNDINGWRYCTLARTLLLMYETACENNCLERKADSIKG